MAWESGFLRENIEHVIKTDLKSACLSPSSGADLFLSYVIDDIMRVVYQADMYKFGGRNMYRKVLKESDK